MVEGSGYKSTDTTIISREMDDNIPEPMKAKWAHEDTYKRTALGDIISLGVFHGQEMTQFNTLSSGMKAAVSMLTLAIKGLVVMSAELEDAYNCFLIQKGTKIIICFTYERGPSSFYPTLWWRAIFRVCKDHLRG